jgi:hypothetical protein
MQLCSTHNGDIKIGCSLSLLSLLSCQHHDLFPCFTINQINKIAFGGGYVLADVLGVLDGFVLQ